MSLWLPPLPETHLELPGDERECLGLSSGTLILRRAWPFSAGHLGLEYIAADERIVSGQWFSDMAQLSRVMEETARAAAVPPAALASVPELRLLLQGSGADRSLPGLAPLVARPGASLIAHRPERRAVVRLHESEEVCYAKVVHPARAAALVATNQAVQRLTPDAFATPTLLETDVAQGVLVCSALPGHSLYDLLGTPRLVSAARSAGQALRALHSVPPPVAAAPHHPADEIAHLKKWLVRLEAFGLDEQSPFHTLACQVFREVATDSGPPALLHRDFYDKQILIDSEGCVGLLDFDTLAVGEPALDLANALVHLELRAMQGRCTLQQASAAAAAFLEGYRPPAPVRRRLQAYAAASRLRLACVYAFRPAGAVLTPLLLLLLSRRLYAERSREVEGATSLA